jgi:hypothetical protein
METQNYFSAAEEQFREMKEFLQSFASHRLDLSGLEDRLSTDGRELLRHLLLAHLAERGVGDIGESVLGADGILRTHKRLRIRTITTLFGPIPIQRLAYSMPHASSVFPLDAMLNLPLIKISYTLQKHFVLEVIKSSFNEALDTVARWTGVTMTKKHALEIVRDAALDFAQFYTRRCRQESPEAQALPLLILTADGKGILVRTQDLRPATRKRAAQQKLPHKGGVATTIRRHARRMATVASVYEVDRFVRTPEDIVENFFPTRERPSHSRPVPKAKRLWASLKQAPETVIRELFDDALRRDPDLKKDWVVVVDGDPHQIARFRRLAKTYQVPLTIICDIVHVLGYVWKAAAVLQEGEQVAPWVRERLYRIVLGKSSSVAAGMRRSATCRKLTTTVREPLDACARYLVNHTPYLAYHESLERGYPIASGVIEGACRYLVKDRMELTGARWSLEGAEAVLKLRAVKVSGDFSTYWTFYEQQQYERIHKHLYQNPSVLTHGGIGTKTGNVS